MRRYFVAGNWKMNLDLAGGTDLASGIVSGLDKANLGDRVDVAVCPPAVYLVPIAEALRGSGVAIGAQDVYHELKGAFTGEVSPRMLADVGVKYVIIGHSERRHAIGHLEDDRMINLKVRAAHDAGLIPILCVGETIAERKAGLTLEVLTFQLRAGLIGLKAASPGEFVIAYEPVWAIGTGETATPEQAQEAHAHLRGQLDTLMGQLAEGVRILYGGSMKPENAGELLDQPDVDGGLIGGASLKADSFVGIVEEALARA